MLMFGSLIRVFCFVAVVTASSPHFGEVTPKLEPSIKFSEVFDMEEHAVNLTVSNDYGRLTITSNLEDGSIKVNRYNHCMAYIEFQDGDLYDVDHDGTDLLKDEKNPFKMVHFILGDANTHTGILDADFKFVQTWGEYTSKYPIHTVLLPVSQGEKEVKDRSKEMKGESKGKRRHVASQKSSARVKPEKVVNNKKKKTLSNNATNPRKRARDDDEVQNGIEGLYKRMRTLSLSEKIEDKSEGEKNNAFQAPSAGVKPKKWTTRKTKMTRYIPNNNSPTNSRKHPRDENVTADDTEERKSKKQRTRHSSEEMEDELKEEKGLCFRSHLRRRHQTK